MKRIEDRFPFTEDRTYRVTFYYYHGGSYRLDEGISYPEARNIAASRIGVHRRSDRPVSTLSPGWEWELEEDDEGMHMIPDEGTLEICCDYSPEEDEEDLDLDW